MSTSATTIQKRGPLFDKVSDVLMSLKENVPLTASQISVLESGLWFTVAKNQVDAYESLLQDADIRTQEYALSEQDRNRIKARMFQLEPEVLRAVAHSPSAIRSIIKLLNNKETEN